MGILNAMMEKVAIAITRLGFGVCSLCFTRIGIVAAIDAAKQKTVTK